MENCKKPPLGIMPRALFETERRIDILLAMERYSMAEMIIPVEWIRELMDLENSRLSGENKFLKELKDGRVN